MHGSHAKAQLVALSAFSAMYFGAIVFVFYERPMAETGILRLLLNLDAFLACIVAGYLAAAVSRRRGIKIGALTGLFAACLVGIYHFLFSPGTIVIDDWRFWTASILLGGFGGLLWSLREAALRSSESS